MESPSKRLYEGYEGSNPNRRYARAYVSNRLTLHCLHKALFSGNLFLQTQVLSIRLWAPPLPTRCCQREGRYESGTVANRRTKHLGKAKRPRGGVGVSLIPRGLRKTDEQRT